MRLDDIEKAKGSQSNTRFTNRNIKNMFSDTFAIEITRIFKAMHQMRLYNVHNYPNRKTYLAPGQKDRQNDSELPR